MRRRHLLAGMGAMVLLPRAVSASSLDGFAARWRFVGGSTERAKAFAAVDEGTASLNLLFRGIARKMIKERTHFPPWLEFTFTEQDIEVDHTTSTIVAPRSGRLVPWVNEHGDHVKARHRVVRGRIMQQIVDPRGDRINVFRIHEDDPRRLTMYVTVRAHQMPDDVDYRLSYRRADSG